MAFHPASSIAQHERDAAFRKLDKEISEAHQEGRAVLCDQLLDERLQIMASRREQDEANAA